MRPQFFDILWLAIKYTAPVVTAFYGFYAIVTDFRIEKDGQKVLTAKAYWGMALLVVSTAFGLASDAHKDQQDRAQTQAIIGGLQSATSSSLSAADAAKQAADASERAAKGLGGVETKLNDNVNTTASVLQEELKAADPIDRNWAAVYTRIEVPLDQRPVQSYVKRVLQANTSYFKFDLGEPKFPDEKIDGAELANLAHFAKVRVSFYKGKGPTWTPSGKGANLPALTIWADCDLAEGVDLSRVKKDVTYNGDRVFSKESFEVSCLSQSAHEVESQVSLLRSYRDLPGLRVLVHVTIMAKQGNPGIEFQLRQFSLVTSTSRWLTIPALKATPCPGGPRAYLAVDTNYRPEDVCFESFMPREFRF
jgi:hypothetical protein